MQKDVFRAIADPTRRKIINLIAVGPMNLNAVADNFEISRPAVSKHIKILSQSGLIKIRKQGRERICEPQLQNLEEAYDFIGQYQKFWNSKLDALDSFLTNKK